jgi:periplasmic protein TonB
MSTPGLNPQAKPNAQPLRQDVLPTLFGEGYGIYAVKPKNFIASVVLHTLAAVAILLIANLVAKNSVVIKQQVAEVVTDISPYILKPSKTQVGGGGGGGDRDKFLPTKGKLPKQSMEQFTPPVRVIRNERPKLIAVPTVIVPPSVKLANLNMPQFGDVKSTVLGPDSSGTGSGGGIGVGAGGGVGAGTGAGVGPGYGGGVGGGIFHVGGGVSAPKAVFAPEPEYSEEARKAKYQGTVVLWLIVGEDGRTHDARVQRQLGMGLDEKAIEAVKQWRFEPAMKDGHPVKVQVAVEVNFRLY